MITQTVFDTSRVFTAHGITHVVLSPGSRNAPLTLSFARNEACNIYNIVDERSAAFIALGMAQRLNKPVVLCCTSGTALLNYAPAVAEARYQQIPLVVISADRPPEWQEQRDGQTIDQLGALDNFIKKSFNLPVDTSHQDAAWEYNRKLNEAINTCQQGPAGPVHINIPFREPFYPGEQQINFSEQVRTFKQHAFTQAPDWSELLEKYEQYDRPLLVIGQQRSNQELERDLPGLAEHLVPVADVISNVLFDGAIRHQDLFLTGMDPKLQESLRPDLLITCGKSVISKSLKTYLRTNPPKAHWHIDPDGVAPDTFQHLTDVIRTNVEHFTHALANYQPPGPEFNLQVRSNFIQNWKIENDKLQRRMEQVLATATFCEFTAFDRVIASLPANIDLHLANSMPVRFANFIQQLPEGVEVYANRGTSGIDGTNGTAVGNALVADKTTLLLTGDLSFFYDRNAFFHPYSLEGLKIIVFNNGGGGIFRLIPGPKNLPERPQHFETAHQHSAKFTALEYGFDYHSAKDYESLDKALNALHKDDKTPKLLEIFLDGSASEKAYADLRQEINDR
ncbi:2-succinyl-5-enolpyruvyl-6-hydroxy-3-cyclohexene-1-carboxylic-acid synthase [Marinoscillum furvescens]|uniref:2-succinyl-5-enolpyruvyl-6-hydroxy-3-cyclohexene-1-carboxylate synthase n=1 Tax=Marinoscillum furvescens DSM 4134 TaxID=1122208 RepID=A0A3D9KY51_MARFU|nr:2-succinyl-5-enolpyruvyl-6-hydroxy-3-cyclohexene-1-carboxylic-acid synthase [Marinoscillum furvescens]RED93892.1 2-succinyl-5-enolpyruvyl-6-hydroxy-3-cyclohexene-1-carboxylate synthase [Marinoscillum furvescens DSM 4134]